MSRADGGVLPLMDNHGARIGVIRDFRVEGGKTRGDAHFSKNRDNAAVIFNDIKDGMLAETSIRAKLDGKHIIDRGEYFEATRWTPVEGSFVDIPADVSTGVNRTFEEHETMDPKPNKSGNDNAGTDFQQFQATRNAGRNEGAEATRADIRANLQAIDSMFAPWLNRGEIFTQAREYAKNELMDRTRAQQLLQDCIDEAFQQTSDFNTVKRQAAGSMNAPGEAENPFIQGGTEELDKKIDAIRGALEHRAHREISRDIQARSGAGDQRHHEFKTGAAERMRERAKELDNQTKDNPYTSYNLLELARAWAELARIPVKGLNRSQIIGKVFLQRDILGHTSGNFTSLLENITNKSLQIGYEEASETWQRFCSVGSLSNFLQGSRPNLSAFSDLDELPENGEIYEGTLSDVAEKIQLATFAKLFSISRQAIINDDASGFSRIPMVMGRAANRKVGDTVYNHLINGHTRTLDQDSTALFHASHNNYVASGAGGAPADATLQAAKTAMATQTDPSGNATLNLMLAYLLVPWALIGTATKLQTGDYDPTSTIPGPVPNIHQGTFEPIADARLDADSATKWYGTARPGSIELIEVAFLDGNQSPMLEQVNAWNTDGVKFKVVHDHAAEPLDFRGLYLNWGA